MPPPRLQPLPLSDAGAGEEETERVPAVVVTPFPQIIPTWREMTGEERDRLMHRVLHPETFREDDEETVVPRYTSEQALGGTWAIVREYARDEFFHRREFGEALFRRVAYRANLLYPGEQAAEFGMETVIEELTPENLVYAFCETYGPLVGVEVPIYGERYHVVTRSHERQYHTQEEANAG